jgi:peptide/nickel transport system ATP-binding protein
MPGKNPQTPLLSVKNLAVFFSQRGELFRKKTNVVRAVDDVSFSIHKGETLGLVGESGCGKSTTGLALTSLLQPTSGQVYFDGEQLNLLSNSAQKRLRKRLQIIFQDPYSSLNPRQKVSDIIKAPLDIHHSGDPTDRMETVLKLMKLVGLRPDQASGYPHHFSGGQRQRIGIARALALKPDLIVCDEPVSALDVSVQAQILNLLADLQKDMGLSYLFISHDLGVVQHIANRVAVMYLGKIVELAPTETLFSAPRHPYTELLMRSAPRLDPRNRHNFSASSDDIPSAADRPKGCAFHTRCPIADNKCRTIAPVLVTNGSQHGIACHHC